MTQESRHQAEHITLHPFPSDPGPYSGDQWAERERVIFTGDQYALQGPLVRYLNELEVTDNDATSDDEVYVDQGAAFVNGHWFHSDEQETFSIPAGPVGGRRDRVVLVENNTNATITAPAAAPSLAFILPNDTSEYDQATPGVPAYSARLAIVRGTGALPGIDKDATIYMVELARYTVDNGPEFSSQEDRRNFCHFSTLADKMVIETTILGAPAATITFAAIPQFYRHLRISGQARSDDAASSDEIRLRFNGDATASYDWVRLTGNTAGAVASTGATATNEIEISIITGDLISQDAADNVDIFINGYRQTAFFKSATCVGQTRRTAANPPYVVNSAGWWHSTAAITSISLTLASAANFETGTIFTLCGLL